MGDIGAFLKCLGAKLLQIGALRTTLQTGREWRLRPIDRPIPPWRSVLALLAAWGVAFAGLVTLAVAIVGRDLELGLGVALAFVAQELGTTLLVGLAASWAIARERRATATSTATSSTATSASTARCVPRQSSSCA